MILDYLASKGQKVCNTATDDDTHIWYDERSNDFGAYMYCIYNENEITFKELQEILEGDSTKSDSIDTSNFDPDKPFEVSNDGTFTDIKQVYKHYIGFNSLNECHYVILPNDHNCYWFKYIRNIEVKKIKRSDIISIKTSEGEITNFEIID